MASPSSMGEYLPPSAEDVQFRPADATEDSKQPLLVKEPAEMSVLQERGASEDDVSERPNVSVTPQSSIPVTTPVNLPHYEHSYLNTNHHIPQRPAIAQGSPLPMHPPISNFVDFGGSNFADIPDAAAYWQMQTLPMFFWMVSSVVSFLLFLVIDLGTNSGLLLMAEVAAMLAIIGSSMHLCRSRSGIDLANQTRLIALFGLIAAILDVFTLIIIDAALLLLSASCEVEQDDCGALWIFLVMITLTLGSHSFLSVRMSQKARHVRMMLSPVSAGIITLA